MTTRSNEPDVQPPDGLEVPRSQTSLHWGRFLALLTIGVVLGISAFVADDRGWSNLATAALLQIGIAVGLVGVIMVLQRFLVRKVEERFEQVAINCYVRNPAHDSEDWSVRTAAEPGDELEFMIRFENVGNTTLKNVAVGNNLPQFMRYVEGSTQLRNSTFPDGIDISSDNLPRGGIDVGSYGPGAAGYVKFTALSAPVPAYENLGVYALSNVAIVRPEGLDEHYNTAQIVLDVSATQSVG